MKIKKALPILLIIAGIIIAGYPLVLRLQTNLEQARLLKEFDNQASIPFEYSSEDEPDREPPAWEEWPDTKLEIPKLSVGVIVVHVTDLAIFAQKLNYPLGHYPESALPGEEGNVAIAAHRNGPADKICPGQTPSGRFWRLARRNLPLENEKGQVLIAKGKKGKKLAGYWEFPGGKIEKRESTEQSLIRELKEEMNLEIEVGNFVGENIHFYDEGTIRLLAYKGKIIGGNIKLADHEECAWVDLQGLRKVELAPADIPFVEMLMNGSGAGSS